MPYTEQETKEASINLIKSLDDLLTWRWEEDKGVLLAEFASGKIEQVVTILQQYYTHEWDKKLINKAPASIKTELDTYANLIKEQRIFTNSPKSDQKSVAAILWPWGHGSTYSLRLTLLDTPYVYSKPIPPRGFLSKLYQNIKDFMV